MFPEHSNPVDSNDSLNFVNFGCDRQDMCNSAMFSYAAFTMFQINIG